MTDILASELNNEVSTLEDAVNSSFLSLPTENMLNDDIVEVEEFDDDLTIVHMDIREPLSTLRSMLEEKVNIDLSQYTFTLQETQILENQKTLVDQCVQGEGFVQINLKISETCKTIDIVDVLKPSEEYLEVSQQNSENGHFCDTPSAEECTKWISDPDYRKQQIRLQIPFDPMDWELAHVRHWILWAVRQFNLSNVKLVNWMIDGKGLCSISKEEFSKKIPDDPGGIFWVHFSILRKCKIVAIQKYKKNFRDVNDLNNKQTVRLKRKWKSHEIINDIGEIKYVSSEESMRIEEDKSVKFSSSNIKLWQFLLELLTDRMHQDSIRWLGRDGQFLIVQPNVIAQMWGERKNKPKMNYEKLSRALRYYYDGIILSKVVGRNFVYKFDCDLKFLTGYSAEELHEMVLDDNIEDVEIKIEDVQFKMENPSF